MLYKLQSFLYKHLYYAYPASDGSRDEYHIIYTLGEITIDLCQGFSEDKHTYSANQF